MPMSQCPFGLTVHLLFLLVPRRWLFFYNIWRGSITLPLPLSFPTQSLAWACIHFVNFCCNFYLETKFCSRITCPKSCFRLIYYFLLFISITVFGLINSVYNVKVQEYGFYSELYLSNTYLFFLLLLTAKAHSSVK